MSFVFNSSIHVVKKIPRLSAQTTKVKTDRFLLGDFLFSSPFVLLPLQIPMLAQMRVITPSSKTAWPVQVLPQIFSHSIIG